MYNENNKKQVRNHPCQKNYGENNEKKQKNIISCAGGGDSGPLLRTYLNFIFVRSFERCNTTSHFRMFDRTALFYTERCSGTVCGVHYIEYYYRRCGMGRDFRQHCNFNRGVIYLSSQKSQKACYNSADCCKHTDCSVYISIRIQKRGEHLVFYAYRGNRRDYFVRRFRNDFLQCRMQI